MDPSVTFDLVHVTLSLGELAKLVADGFGLLRDMFCALPFITFC
jgi:hypothetical protein